MLTQHQDSASQKVTGSDWSCGREAPGESDAHSTTELSQTPPCLNVSSAGVLLGHHGSLFS